MPKLVNRAKMTTATTGTGTLTLGSAVDGYQTFANAGVANSNVVRYTIEDGSAWEIGLGTYSSTGTTLTRGTIESSTGTAINLSGNATVFVTAAAGDLQELVTFAETFALPTADGTNGQVLTTNGSGTLTFSTISGYTNADVDAHLNTSTAASGEVLSWNGSDYDWVAAPAALLGDTDSASPFETSLGFEAGLNTTGVRNTFVGYQAGKTNTTGAGNTALGYFAGTTLNSNQNTMVGSFAGRATTTGANNSLFGDSAGTAITTGSGNVAFGKGAMSAATTGGRNIAIGEDAMGSGVTTTTNGYNVAIGYLAGTAITTATNNIAIGFRPLVSATSGSTNIGLGLEPLFSLSTGGDNTALGFNAGHDLTTGSNNVAIGNGALDAATTGGRNIAIGQDAMGLGVATAASGDNIAIGYQAGYDLTTGTDNVMIGELAGANITTGSYSVAIGYQALDAATTASQNIAIGERALSGVSTGTANTVVGSVAGFLLSTSNNTLIGHNAAGEMSTGANNTALGAFAGYGTGGAFNNITGSNNIWLGYNATGSALSASNEITLGNSSITTLRCQVTTITSLSDARDKTDIQPLKAGLDFVETLNPVSFTWNMRDGGKVGEADTGFIAQDLQMAQEWAGVTIPGLVYDVNPDKLEAGYGKLIPVLVQAIKDLSAKVNYLEAQLEAKP